MIDVVFRDTDGTLYPLVLDATPTEQHRANAIATEQEVERGVSVADHYRPERRTFTVEAVISDTPIAPNEAIGVSLEPIDLDLPSRLTQGPPKYKNGQWEGATPATAAAPPTRLTVLQPTETPNRVLDSWALLKDARDRALLATVTTAWETYEDCVLLELLANRTAADGSWMRVSMTFAELRMVSTQLVADPVPLRPRDHRQTDRGSQEAEEASPRLRSLARQGLDAVAPILSNLGL